MKFVFNSEIVMLSVSKSYETEMQSFGKCDTFNTEVSQEKLLSGI